MKDVSIVIVCMNNLRNLYPCLESVKKYTTLDYEVLVVAFMFSEENIHDLTDKYPFVDIVRSDELRGFAENNNLALRKAKGRYCFVLNDDTYFNMPVIDELVARMDNMQDNIAILSPLIINPNGSVQGNGKYKYNIFTYILGCLHMRETYDRFSKYTGKTGIYRTYNISGACFLIRTDIFRNMGWLDDRYYFCPEDIALSTKLNKNGYLCYVDTNVSITHIQGGTWSNILTATMPVVEKGNKIFYCEDNKWFTPFFVVSVWARHGFSSLIHYMKYFVSNDHKSLIRSIAHLNTARYITTSETPKECFIRLYKKIKK